MLFNVYTVNRTFVILLHVVIIPSSLFLGCFASLLKYPRKIVTPFLLFSRQTEGFLKVFKRGIIGLIFNQT